MILSKDAIATAREQLGELLHGGFAPVVILLREFHYDKAGIMLEGLPFSTWSILEHMRWRQEILLRFMKDPEDEIILWPEPYWPDNPVPANEMVWNDAISSFERDLTSMIGIVEDPETPLFQLHKNGKTIFWAAVATLQHNGYHIGQIKTIGRQTGVW